MKKMKTVILIAAAVLLLLLLAVLLTAGRDFSKGGKRPEMSEEEITSILENQEFLFMMSYRSYSERYIAGYAIGRDGKKYSYALENSWPFESPEEEFSYITGHFDELETVELWDEETVRACTEALYSVDAGAKIKKGGRIAEDAPFAGFCGIRVKDGKREFISLMSNDSGLTEKLKDPSADFIMEQTGDRWSLP